jgi:hypothetical protein
MLYCFSGLLSIKLFTKSIKNCKFLCLYSVFQGFSKAKSANGGSILSSSHFFDTAPAASKNKACFKSGQSWLKNNHLATYDLNPWNSLYVSVSLSLSACVCVFEWEGKKRIFDMKLMKHQALNDKIWILRLRALVSWAVVLPYKLAYTLTRV